MALPPSIHYFGMRLRPLAQPIVWFPPLLIILLGTVLWQYRVHPEWSGQFEVDEPTPNAGTLLPEGEVPTELPTANTSRDTERTGLMGLLADLGLLGPERQSDQLGVVPQVQQETPESLLSLLIESDTLADPEATESNGRQRLAGTPNPFARYTDAYQLPGAGAAGNSRASLTPSNLNDVGDFLNFLNFNQADGNVSETQTANGSSGATPLERALNQRQVAAENAATVEAAAQETADANATAQSNLDVQGNSQNPAVIPGNIPGVPYTFIQTTPQMSPPAGTTGYTTPPSLNLTLPQATTGGSFPAAGTTATPSFQTPTTSGVSGSTLPPTSGSQYSQPQFTNPQPFSAPRPNGRYIGNGEIQTFSNPLGSSSWDPSDYTNR